MKYGWTLERQMWDRLLRIASGTDWKPVYLDKLYQDTVPEDSGVYAICAKTPGLKKQIFEKLYSVIYIGKEGVSLRRRFLEHCRTSNSDLLQAKQCFGEPLDYWYTTANPEMIDELESYLIGCFGPIVNKVGGLKIYARIGNPIPA